MENEELAGKNAVATAEGAICEAVTASPVNLEGSLCLLSGYGRCGRVIAAKLKALGAKITVLEADPQKQSLAKKEGFSCVQSHALIHFMENHPVLFIFNTAPCPVFGREILEKTRPDITIIDIASAPGGTDFDYCKKTGRMARLCPGLPGKYAPKSSAEILGNAILSFLSASPEQEALKKSEKQRRFSMTLSGKTIGFAFTGSFCTFDAIEKQVSVLLEAGARIQPIFSANVQTTDSRFGSTSEYIRHITELTGSKPILTTEEAEPLGPSACLDILLLAPCTGNTLAKLANGITDSPVLMAAKAHLRNLKPLVISISTNDALGMNFKNIGLLYNTKHIYFVPFGQDNPEKKPNSLIARTHLIKETLELALEERQIQPVLR